MIPIHTKDNVCSDNTPNGSKLKDMELKMGHAGKKMYWVGGGLERVEIVSQTNVYKKYQECEIAIVFKKKNKRLHHLGIHPIYSYQTQTLL